MCCCWRPVSAGRLDATNVIDRPALTVITPVSIDHTEFLGASLGAIAFEKAGILKPGVGAVIAPQAPEAADVIEARAAAIGTPLSRHGAEWSYAATEHGFVYRRAEGARDFPAPALPGPCQVENAAVAIACLDRLSALRAGRRAIEDGLRTAAWPGRLQRLRRGPLVERLPREDGWEIWLDGGHNPGAAAMLARMAAGWTDRPLHLVLGLLETKGRRRLRSHLSRLRGERAHGSDHIQRCRPITDLSRGHRPRGGARRRPRRGAGRGRGRDRFDVEKASPNSYLRLALSGRRGVVDECLNAAGRVRFYQGSLTVTLVLHPSATQAALPRGR